MGLFARWKAKRQTSKPLVIHEKTGPKGPVLTFNYDLVGQKGLLPLLRLCGAKKVFFVIFDLEIEEKTLRTYVSSLADVELFSLASSDGVSEGGWAFYLGIDWFDYLFAFFQKEKASFTNFFIETPYVEWKEFTEEIADPNHPLPSSPKPVFYLAVAGNKNELDVDQDYPCHPSADDIGRLLTGQEIV